MVKQVKIYVEGGGDRALDHTYCRKGFHKLLDGTVQRKPRIIAGGGRNATFEKFKTELRSSKDVYPILLVDSEDALQVPDINAWVHLKNRDQWERPPHVKDEQAQLMVTCMETWIMADQDALQSFYGAPLNRKSLLPIHDLESKNRHTVQDALEKATRNCGPDRMYQKGKRSFRILGELNPDKLKEHLPHFNHLAATLSTLLDG